MSIMAKLDPVKITVSLDTSKLDRLIAHMRALTDDMHALAAEIEQLDLLVRSFMWWNDYFCFFRFTPISEELLAVIEERWPQNHLAKTGKMWYNPPISLEEADTLTGHDSEDASR